MPSRKAVYWLIFLLLMFAVAEACAYVVGRYILPHSIVFNPGFVKGSDEQLAARYEAYLVDREPVLGWPSQKHIRQTEDYDSTIGRRNLVFGDPEEFANCVSLFGDSYTWSSEVTYEYAWASVLTEKLGCRVGNYGVGGYGSDQAYMRYLSKPGDQARVVFLNHLSENIIRNVGQFKNLVGGYKKYAPLTFKPRFIVDRQGSLRLIDMPTFASSIYPDVVRNPEDHLEHEYFLPNGDSGLRRLDFPYMGFLIGTVLGHFHVRAELSQRPWFMEFYDEDHPSAGLDVTAAIMLAFRDSARERGQIPVLTVIPTGLDLVYFSKNGVWPYQNLLDRLTESDVDVFNFGPGIMARLDGADPCTLFDSCNRHYNEAGYAYIGEIAYEEIVRRDLLKTILATGEDKAN